LRVVAAAEKALYLARPAGRAALAAAAGALPAEARSGMATVPCPGELRAMQLFREPWGDREVPGVTSMAGPPNMVAAAAAVPGTPTGEPTLALAEVPCMRAAVAAAARALHLVEFFAREPLAENVGPTYLAAAVRAV
jgi:hypothetical protein